jgi:hypothetical protein
MIHHYTQWIYNQIAGTDYAKGQRFEMRITCGVNDYDYDVHFPADSIILDKSCFKILDFGKLSMRRFDENAALELTNRTFTIKDNWAFSGISNSVHIGMQDLSTQNTSLIPFIFNDLTKIYYVHLTQLHLDGTPVTDGIYYSGEIDPSLITTEDIIYLKALSSSQMKLGNKKLISVSGSALLKSHTVEEIVSGSRTNGVPDGLVPGLLQSDMEANSGAAMYDGFLTSNHPRSDSNYAKGVAGAILPSGTNFSFDLSHFPDRRLYSQFNYVNYYGVNNGLQNLSWETLIKKMTQIMGIHLFSAADAEFVFREYYNLFAGVDLIEDRYSLQKFGVTTLNDVNLNYNVKLGVNPYDWHSTNNDFNFPSPDHLIAGLVDVTASPVKITTTTDHHLHTGMYVNATDIANSFPALWGGLITVIDHNNFTFDSSINTDPFWVNVYNLYFGGNNYYDIQTPASWARNKTFSELLKLICFDRGFAIDWDIIQSGADKGKLKLLLVNALADTGEIPVKWSDYFQRALLQGASQTEVTLAKHHIKIKYDWDSQEIFFPDDKGEEIEIIIDQSAKRWGLLPGLFDSRTYEQSDFINNPARDINSQEGGEILFDLNSDWWIRGTRDSTFVNNTRADIVNSGWINHSFGVTNNVWAAYYNAAYEEYQGSATVDASNYNADYYNRAISKGIFWANVFLLNTTIQKLAFRSCVDDSGLIKTIKPRLSHSWRDDDGIVRKKLLHAIDIQEIKGLCDTEFINAPSDYTVLTHYDHFVKNPNSGSGGITATNTVSGGGTTDGGNFLKKFPNLNSDNKIAATSNVELGLDYQSIGSQLRSITLFHTAAQNDDLATEDANGVGYTENKITTATGAYSISGFTGGIEDKQLRVWNDGAYILTIKNSTGSSANNQILTIDGTDSIVAPGGYAEFIYRSNKWQVTNIYPENVTDANDVVTNPAATQTIQATDNAAIGLIVKGKAGSSVKTFSLQTSGAADVLNLDNFGLLNLTNPIFYGSIGVDTGSSIDSGLDTYVLACFTDANHHKWIDPASFLTNAVIINPLTSGRNLIASTNDILLLNATSKTAGISDISHYISGAGALGLVINWNGFIQVGDNGSVLGLGTPLTVAQIANSIGAIFKQSTGANLIEIWTSANAAAIAINATAITLNNIGGTPTQLEFFNTGNTKKTILKANTSIAADIAFTLPNADGTIGQVLQTDGGGILSFVTVGLIYITETLKTAAPNATVNVEELKVNATAPITTTADLSLMPRGTGALLAATPDNTATGGNKRGTNAVDLQTSRIANTQVANGNSSVIGGGGANTASGSYATVAGGQGNTASGNESFVGSGESNVALGVRSSVPGGINNNANGDASIALGSRALTDKLAQLALSSGRFSANGDAQLGMMVALKITTDATANVELLLNQTDHVTLSNNTVWTFSVLVVGKQAASTNYASFTIQGSVVRGVGAGTVVVNGVATTTINDTIGVAAVASVLADVANGGIKIVVTGKAATTINWVARLDTVEVTLA